MWSKPAATSVRSRVLLLALLACLLLVGAASALVLLLHSNQFVEQAAIATHLETVAHRLARDYSSRSQWSDSGQLEEQPGGALSDPQAPGAGPVLALMTAAALQHEPGVEGGFYARASNALVGYAFPTRQLPSHRGQRDQEDRMPNPKQAPPPRESEALLALAARAVATGTTQQMRLSGPRDAALLLAVPVVLSATATATDANTFPKHAGSFTPGAVWLMQRIPAADAGMRQRMLAGIGGFAVGGLACALIAFLVVAQVQRAVRTTAGYLETLGSNLAVERPPSLPLAEFEAVLHKVAALAAKLRAQQELERQMAERLRHQDRLASLGQFAAGIAHEIRNPLATIRLRLQMTERSSTEETTLRNNAIALEEIARMDKMIAKLLYFSRPLAVEREVVNLEALCRACLQSLQVRLHEQGIVASLQSEGPALVMAEASQLRQVLDNVLLNAVEALEEVPQSADGGARALHCRLRRQGSFVICAVQDSGPGLSAKAASHAMDAFFTTKEKGTGLGLSIAHEILQVYGGRLQLENASNPGGGGALATLWLPAAGAGEKA